MDLNNAENNSTNSMPAANKGFGVRRGVVSWDTSQEFESSPPVRAFAKPRPPLSPQNVIGKRRTA